jgi:hypothetical protein
MIPAYMSAQDQQQEKQKTPVEIASEQADKLQEQLKLNNKQLFQVDSVLQNNITGVTADFEKLKKGGRMSSEAYIQVRDSWQLKTEEAFKKILTEEQFKKYMIFIGKMDNKGRMKKQPRY